MTSDPATLDRYESLIEQALLAGRVQEAVELYWHGLGAYRNLVWVLGENARGLRILERFVPSLIERDLPGRVQGGLLTDLGLFAANLGDLPRARAAFSRARQLAAAGGDHRNECVCTQNLAEFALQAGRFPEARDYSESAVSLATQANDDSEIAVSLAYRATARFALGDLERAAELEGKPLYGVCGIWQAWRRLLRGDRHGAIGQAQANREFAAAGGYEPDLCRSNALLARLLLPDDPAQAARHLQDARAFANGSGVVELQLRCFHAACELHRHLRDYPQAIAEADAGILLADTCGFGWFSIDLRLAAGDARSALQRSEHPDCQYAWGKATALRLIGAEPRP